MQNSINSQLDHITPDSTAVRFATAPGISEQPPIHTIPSRLLRLPQVLNLVPIGRSTLWAYVAKGKFPQPVKISERCTAWRESDVHAWLARLS